MFLLRTRIISSVTVTSLLLLLSYSPAQAVSSKTYNLTEQTAASYTTTGNVQFKGNGSSDWYNPAWKYRQKITIHKEFVGEELTDFPVLIRLNNSTQDQMRDDRHDLVFTSQDGVTKLAHDIEDNTTVWVKVPKLSSTSNTSLYLYYGNPDSEDQSDADQVWTNGYSGVWHLNQDPGGQAPSMKDVTKHNNHGTAQAVTAGDNRRVTGKIAQATQFKGVNGTADYISIPSNDTLNAPNDLTFSAWIKRSSVPNYEGIMARTNGSLFDFDMNIQAASSKVNFYADAGSSTLSFLSTTTITDTSRWHHIVLTRSGTTAKIYIDGRLDNSTTFTGTFGTNAYPVEIGRDGNWGASSPYNGLVDEARIIPKALTDAWIKAEYANQSETENFLSISSDREQQSESASIMLKAQKALNFATLHGFKDNAGGTVTYQLSPDAGKNWYSYTPKGWKATKTAMSSAHDINAHISSLPKGTGKLVWKAYLEPGATLDDLTITYSGSLQATSNQQTSIPTSLSDPRIKIINQLHQQVYGQIPTFTEWSRWANLLVTGKKTTTAELLGAMQWQKLFGPR